MVKPKPKRTKAPTCKPTLTLEEFYNLRVEAIMDKRIWDLPLIEKDNDVLHVLAILSSSDHLWVVESLKGKKLVGVITEHDILRILAPAKKISFFGRHPRSAMHPEMYETAEHVMEYHPITCSPDNTVEDVLHKMMSHNCRRLAVVKPNNGKVIGEITLHHLVRMYYESIKPLCEM